MVGITVCTAAPTKNEPSPARMIMAASTRSLLTSPNTRTAVSAPTRCLATMPYRVWPVTFVRAARSVSGK
jgi:hypothetical protein